MENLSNIGVIREILSRHGFQFSKALGQNFLINPSVCPRMAQLAGAKEGVGVLEIGPGIGVLTNELLKRADKVVAVELDKRLLPVLSETLSEYDNFKVISGDVLKLDLRGLIEEEFQGLDVVVCANLPYYITSEVIMKLLEDRLSVKAVTVMVQKEAAERLTAKDGTRESSAITVAVRYYSEPSMLFSVSRGSFMPSPNVDSAVIRLDIREPSFGVKDEKAFFRIVRAACAQRRKTVANSISSALSLDKNSVSDILISVGVSPSARAERLTVEDFASASNAFYDSSML